jgi:hypothetical protein
LWSPMGRTSGIARRTAKTISYNTQVRFRLGLMIEGFFLLRIHSCRHDSVAPPLNSTIPSRFQFEFTVTVTSINNNIDRNNNYINSNCRPLSPRCVLHLCHISTLCPLLCVTFVSRLYPVSLAMCYICVTSLPRVPHYVLHLCHVSTPRPLLCVTFVSHLYPTSLAVCHICVTFPTTSVRCDSRAVPLHLCHVSTPHRWLCVTFV